MTLLRGVECARSNSGSGQHHELATALKCHTACTSFNAFDQCHQVSAIDVHSYACRYLNEPCTCHHATCLQCLRVTAHACSAEEIRAAQAPAAAAEADEAAVPKSKEAMEKALKSLIRSIPSERAGIFAYDINWSAYDSGRSAMAAKILGWVKMKVGLCCFSLDDIAVTCTRKSSLA